MTDKDTSVTVVKHAEIFYNRMQSMKDAIHFYF